MSVSPWGNVSKHIHELCKTLTFGLNFKTNFILNLYLGKIFLSVSNLAHGCITIREHVVSFVTSVWRWPLCGRRGYSWWVLLTVFILSYFLYEKLTLLQFWENHCRLSSSSRGHELYGSTWSDLHVVMFTIPVTLLIPHVEVYSDSSLLSYHLVLLS